MKYEQIDTLEAYLKAVEFDLLREDVRVSIAYPQKWDETEADRLNQRILGELSSKANVYAIFIAEHASGLFRLKYIGKTLRKHARQRLRNHLIKKHAQTGSVLDKVKAEVGKRNLVAISWVSVEPESLRNYLEEELIKRHPEACWNCENRAHDRDS